jgi:hypothetical protein
MLSSLSFWIILHCPWDLVRRGKGLSQKQAVGVIQVGLFETLLSFSTKLSSKVCILIFPPFPSDALKSFASSADVKKVHPPFILTPVCPYLLCSLVASAHRLSFAIVYSPSHALLPEHTRPDLR